MQTSDLNVNNTESDHANAIFRQFQDAIFSREYTSVKTLTKIIFDLLQWQEIATLSLPKKAAIASFIWTPFRGHFRLGAIHITRNRSRVIFCRACIDIFRRWYRVVTCASLHHVIHDRKNVTSSFASKLSLHRPSLVLDGDSIISIARCCQFSLFLVEAAACRVVHSLIFLNKIQEIKILDKVNFRLLSSRYNWWRSSLWKFSVRKLIQTKELWVFLKRVYSERKFVA